MAGSASAGFFCGLQMGYGNIGLAAHQDKLEGVVDLDMEQGSWFGNIYNF